MDTSPQDANSEATLESLAKEYYEVHRAEFILEDGELDTLRENVKTRLKQLTAAAIENAVHLMEHADSDAVRWNVTKYILDNGLFDKETPENELDAIIAGLKGKGKKKAPAS